MPQSLDLRTCMNAVSDVLINRPPPLREIDQIYMKAGDILIHADHMCRWFANRDVVFIGDGDAVALLLIHLTRLQLVQAGPRSIHVLDFDERIVNSVHRFAKTHGYSGEVAATLYNVADALPHNVLNHFSGFHTNPPYGSKNGGESVKVFLQRGIEACRPNANGCIVLADDDEFPWTKSVLASVQESLPRHGYMVAELRPKAHQYHLDDAPDLTSCSLLVTQSPGGVCPIESLPLNAEARQNFYGRNHSLKYERIKDNTAGGRYPSRDHLIIQYEEFDSHGKDNN